MKVLIDTHAFLWFVLNDSRLGVIAGQAMRDPANELLLSPASYWEIAIKVNSGKYHLQQDYLTFMTRQMQQNWISVLPIELRHTASVVTLPQHHRDPFDRLLIAQALVENLPLVSADVVFDQYGVRRIW